MKYDLSEEQYKSIKRLSEMKDTVEMMMSQTIGYHKVSDLVVACNEGKIKVLK